MMGSDAHTATHCATKILAKQFYKVKKVSIIKRATYARFTNLQFTNQS